MRPRQLFMAKVLALSLLTVLAGCAQVIRPISPQVLGSDRIFKKNYDLGQKHSAYVGQPVITVKDYTVTRIVVPRMKPNSDFSMSGGLERIRGYANTEYPVRGELTLEGTTYRIVALPGPLAYGVLVAPDGSVLNRVLNHNVIMVYHFTIEPPGLRFLPSSEEKIDSKAGYLNFELLYGGTDGKSFTLTYREYTSDNLIRPAFTQNVVYQANSPAIRFRNIRIQIHEATSENLVYTVVADNLGSE